MRWGQQTGPEEIDINLDVLDEVPALAHVGELGHVDTSPLDLALLCLF
jgi:hypothetical protein